MKNDKKIRVLVVDDHSIVRDGLISMFHDDEDIVIAGEAGSADEALKAAEKLLPEVILMDISLGTENGIDVTKKILSLKPEIGIIILSMFVQNDTVLLAIEAGAKAYLSKNSSRDDIKIAIRKVAEGSNYFSKEISDLLLNNIVIKKRNDNKADSEKQCMECLSVREIEILRLFAQGHTNQEISELLFISIRTVETHKSHIMQKLNFKSQVELVKFAIRNGLAGLE